MSVTGFICPPIEVRDQFPEDYRKQGYRSLNEAYREKIVNEVRDYEGDTRSDPIYMARMNMLGTTPYPRSGICGGQSASDVVSSGWE